LRENKVINNRLEKYAVFSKDFRGMPDGWHNLQACNFLVGENSTGKSSFLQLLQLLDSREHSMLLDVCGIIEGIDTPFDICSRMTGSKETTIGYLIKERRDESKKVYRGALGRLATYRRVKDEMQLERLSILSGDRLLRLRRLRNRISYRFDDFSYDSEKAHAENAEEFEKYHLSKVERFRKFRDVAWQETPPFAAWLGSGLVLAS
jgi:predicted ATP-dependent endonuclease of OLD family